MKQLWTSILSVVIIAGITLLGVASCGNDDDDDPPAAPPVNQPRILVTPSSHDFGNVEVGLEVGVSVNLKNTGLRVLTVDSMKLDEGPFRLEGDSRFSLNADQSVDRIVHFQPAASDSFAATLRVYSNDSTAPVVNVRFTGKGASDHFPDPAMTGANMSVIVNSLTGLQVVDGSEVACLSTRGAVYGKAKMDPTEHQWGLALWGDDTTTPTIQDGFLEGDSLRFLLWDPVGHREMVPEITIAMGSELRYSTNGLLVLRFAVQ